MVSDRNQATGSRHRDTGGQCGERLLIHVGIRLAKNVTPLADSISDYLRQRGEAERRNRAEALSVRLASLEREVSALGTRVDPYLEFLVRRFASEIGVRDAAGERGVSLVYRAWVASGFAEEAYTPRITVWGPDGVPEVELTPGTPTGDAPRMLLPPDYLQPALQRARTDGAPVFETPEGTPGIQQVAAIPLGEERVATVVVPMRRSLFRSSVLEPLIRERRPMDARLTLMPVSAHPGAETTAGIDWFRTQEGWRGEAALRYPEAMYRAHLELRVAPAGVRLARGMLLIVKPGPSTFDVGALVAFATTLFSATPGLLVAPPGEIPGHTGPDLTPVLTVHAGTTDKDRDMDETLAEIAAPSGQS